jgi:hypothetical protein
MIVDKIIKFLNSIFAKPAQSGLKVNLDEELTKNVSTAIHSIWDYLSIRDNTQAFHLTNVLGLEEWIDMTEIRRRIQELYGIEYKNEKSLYPYLKNMVDLGLVENTFIGGKMRWRKKLLIIRIEKEKEKEALTVTQETN